MSVSRELLDFYRDTLAPLGPVVVKRMFGGAALSLDGVTFALVLDDQLWLKTDPEGISRFETEGSRPFDYATRQGRRVITSYWRAPDRLLDEPDDLVDWARTALAVARQAQSTTRRRPPAKEVLPGERTPKRRPRSSRARKPKG